MMHDENTYLSAENLSVGYGNIPLLEKLSLHAGSSQVIALTGPNGTGKSTLLKTLMGLMPALSGELNIMGQNPATMVPRKKAQLVSFVAANASLPSNLYVHELVAYGRYPYGGLLSRITQEDKIKQQRAMNQMQVDHLARRRIGEISDGEKQRVMIARALAQDTPLVVLDEPASHLDIKNRYELMKLLSRQAAVFGKCIIFSTHDLEIMLNHTDVLWMINQNSIISGLPEDMVLTGEIDTLVSSQNIVFDKLTGKFIIPVNNAVSVCVKSDQKMDNTKAQIYHTWTTHALDRYGFSVDCNKTGDTNVIIKMHDEKVVWKVCAKDSQIHCKSVKELIMTLKKHTL